MMAEETRIRAALPAYVVSGVLGRGAWGVVYSGNHLKLDRAVAIKHLPRNFSEDETVVRRFATEARLAASLDHPHVVPVYDYVEQTGLCLLVMQRLAGGTVADRFAAEGCTVPAACAISLAAASAVQAAHVRGVLHRDIKPANLLLDEDGTVKLADFGVAKVVGGDRTLATIDGAIIGTPAYMAPEQALGDEIGPPADVFALGAVLYELVSGQLTVGRATSAMEVMTKRVSTDAIPLQQVTPEVPIEIADVAMRAVARAATDRYADAESFGVALGDAAARAWGSGWLDETAVPLRDSGRIAATARGSQAAGAGEAASGVRLAAPPTVRVRPQARPEQAAVPLDDIDRDDLVEVKEVLQVPRFPWLPLFLTIGLAAVLVLFGLRSSDGPEREVTVPDGVAFVNGQDIADAELVEVDFGEPLLVDVADPALVDGSAELRFDVMGVPLGSTGARPLSRGSAELHAPTLEYVTSGPITAELTVFDDRGRDVATTEFGVSSVQPAYATVAGVVAILTLLFVFAHVESLLRPLRRGRRRISALVSLALVGGLLGVAVTFTGWALGFGDLAVPRVVASGVLGSSFAVVLGWTAFRVGRRRRIRRSGVLQARF